MVEIKIIENEERNEYLIEPYQAFLGARYDNLSDEIKVTFPQKEIDNGSSCTMIITNGDEPIDCVTVYNDKVFKLESPATQYKQVFIGFSFQKADGYIKNTNAGLFFFRGAQPPDVSVPTTPIQRGKINLLLAEGLAGVRVAEDDPATMEFTNVDGEPIGEFTVPKGEKGRSVFYITQEWSIILDFPVSGMFIDVSKFNGTPNVGDLGIATNGILFEVMDIYGDTSVSCKYLATIKGEKGEKGDKGDAGSIKFIPVATLPTENIDKSAIYLVPIEGEDEQNRFTEYVYIDGKWEIIGAITVQVDHSEYVKFTDINNGYGIKINDKTKKIDLVFATEAEVKGRHNYRVVNPKMGDSLVKECLTDSKVSWTDEEKAAACATIGAFPNSKPSQRNYGDGMLIGFTENGSLVYSIILGGQGGSVNFLRYTIPLRDINGVLHGLTPTTDTGLTPKKYVDDLIAELRAEIAALKGE